MPSPAIRWAVMAFLATGASVGVLLASGSAVPTPSDPYLLVAYGDSFTQAMEPVVGDQPEKSWATGSDPRVRSVLERVRDSRPDASGHNLARSGVRMEDLVRQVAASPRGADQVLILLGINDACLLTDPAEFRTAAREGLEAVRQAHPDAQVVVYAIPDLIQLGSVHEGTPSATLLRLEFDYCRHFFLPGLNALGWGTEDRLAEYNEVLQKEAERAGCGFSNAIHEVQFTKDQLSPVDYFHPTWAGEARLAEAAWPSAAPPPARLEPFFLLR